ncbi:putative transcriptional regulator [Providencia alcalifaciens]|nr:putative transcriptional regulator [Providencia alcalifaciens]
MAERKIKSKDLALELGITEANLSLLKNGKIKGIKFSTLEKLCEILACQPGDIIKYVQ